VIQERLHNFNYLDCAAYQEFTLRQWSKLKFPEICSICELLAEQARVNMDREAKRRKEVLFKWLDENWVKVSPHLGAVRFVYDGDTAHPEV
jgi:hypothetical protein